MTLTLAQPAEDPKQNGNSAMAALLPQLPEALRSQIQQAYEDDLAFMFSTGMDAGKHIAMKTVEKAHRGEKQTKQPAAPSRPKFQVLLGGAL